MRRHVLDFGGRTKTAFMTTDGQDPVELTWDEVLRLPFTLSPGDELIVEKSHMMVPRERSLAQPFDANHLMRFYEDCKLNMISLKFFPEKQTPVAIARYKHLRPEKKKEIAAMNADELSALAIYHYVTDPRVNLTLGNPPKRFTPKKEVLSRLALEQPRGIYEEGWVMKKQLNETLNLARKDEYNNELLRDDKIADFIHQHIVEIRDCLVKKFDAETVNTIFGFEYYSRGDQGLKIRTPKGWSFKMGRLYTILATLMDEEGKLRLREDVTGRFMSVKHIHRHVFCMSPNHFAGGIARSNIMWHGLRNYLRKITWDSKKKKPLDPKVNFRRKTKVVDKDGKIQDRCINRGLFTDEEDKFFIAERNKYMAVIKELNRIFRRLLKPEWYDEHGYVQADSTHLLDSI